MELTDKIKNYEEHLDYLESRYWKDAVQLSGPSEDLHREVVRCIEIFFPNLGRQCYSSANLRGYVDGQVHRRNGQRYPFISQELIEYFELETSLRKEGKTKDRDEENILRETIAHEYGHICYHDLIDYPLSYKLGCNFRMNLDESFAQWFGKYFSGDISDGETINIEYFSRYYPHLSAKILNKSFRALKEEFGNVPNTLKNVPTVTAIIELLKNPQLWTGHL